MTSPLGSTVRVIISGVARTGAAFGRIRRDLRQLVNDARMAARGMRNQFLAGGGIPGLIGRQVAAASAHLRRFGATAARIGGQVLRGAARAGAAAAPYALLAAKIFLVVGAIAALTGIAGNIIGITQLIAPAAVTAGAAVLVLKMAFNGLSDALSAGLSGDTEEFEKQLKKLAPSAASTVRQLVKLRDEWKPLQKLVQEKLFHGVAGELQGLSDSIKPVAMKWLPLIAESFARTRGALAGGLANFARDGRLDKVMANVTSAIDSLLGVAKPLAQAFGDILVNAAPRFAELADKIRGGAQAFADWIRNARDSGKLKEWLDKAWETAGKLWAVFKNLATAVAGIMGASSEGGDNLLDNLVTWTADLSKWVNSGDGQKFIGWISQTISFLSQTAGAIGLVLDYLKLLTAYWQLLWDAAKAAGSGIAAIFQGLVYVVLAWFDMLLTGAAKAFGWVPGIGDKLKKAAREFGEFKDNVNNALAGINKTIDIWVNYRARRIGDHMVRGDEFAGDYRGGGGRAHGGLGSGVVMAGERGPELVDLGAGGRVYNNGDTRKMLAEGSRGQGGTGGFYGFVGSGIGAAFAEIFNRLLRNGDIKMKVGTTGRVRTAT